MIDKNYVLAAFNAHFDKIEKVVEFDMKYHNGTGYLNEARKIPLEEGATAKMITDDGRKCIMVGTLFGTVVVFQRSTGEDKRIVCNYPQELSTFGFHISGSHLVDEADIHHLFGTCESNIGQKIQNLLSHKKVLEAMKEKLHEEKFNVAPDLEAKLSNLSLQGELASTVMANIMVEELEEIKKK